MKVFTQKNLLIEFLSNQKKDIKIGFVPTMGALHEGHTSLILTSKTKCDITTEDKINIKSLIGRQITFKQDTEFIEGKIHNIETDTGIFVIEFIRVCFL